MSASTSHAPHIPPESAHSRPSVSKYVVLALVIGALSGIVAAIAYSAYGPSIQQRFEITRIERELTQWDESKIIAAKEATISLIQERAPSKSTTLELPDVAGFGTIVTSDGWAVVPTTALVRGKRVLVRPQSVLPIVRTVADPTTQLSFIKVDARNMRVLDSVSTNKLVRGQRLAIVMPHSVISVTVRDTSVCISDRCPWEYSDRLSYAPAIVEQLPAHSVDGAAVITTTGALVGIALTSGPSTIIVPMDVIQAQFPALFSQGALVTRELPVRAFNLTRWSVADPQNKLPERGMYIELKTPGAATQLKDGDVITSVERETIEAGTTLFDLIRLFGSQSTITMTVLRRGETMDIRVQPISQQ